MKAECNFSNIIKTDIQAGADNIIINKNNLFLAGKGTENGRFKTASEVSFKGDV